MVWIVTGEVVEAEVVRGERDGRSKGNPYDYVDSQPVKALRRGVAVSAEKLEQRTGELTGMELDAIEVQVEVNGEGQLSLLGSGGKAGMKGSMTLKFKAKKS